MQGISLASLDNLLFCEVVAMQVQRSDQQLVKLRASSGQSLTYIALYIPFYTATAKGKLGMTERKRQTSELRVVP